MPGFCLRAKDVTEGQAVIYSIGNRGEKIEPPKILVRGDFGPKNGISDTIPRISQKIPFAQIGIMKDGRGEFSPMPTDVVSLDESHGLDDLITGWKIPDFR